MTIRARVIAGAIALAAITAFAGPASAQNGQNADWCAGKGNATHDQVISGCTAVIQSAPTESSILLNALFGRAVAYEDSQFDLAIADYDQLIKLVPKDAAYHNLRATYHYWRGNAYSERGYYDRAIQDLDQALMFDPKNALYFDSRGEAYGEKGQYDRAIQDFDQAIKLDPTDTAFITLVTKSRADAIAKKNK